MPLMVAMRPDPACGGPPSCVGGIPYARRRLGNRAGPEGAETMPRRMPTERVHARCPVTGQGEGDEVHGPILQWQGEAGPRLQEIPAGWRVRSALAARALLRARGATSQAGFTAEAIPAARMKRRPILISDGPEHDAQRRELGRFLAPDVVEHRWRDLIDERADALVARVAEAGYCDAGAVALEYTVDVTRQIVGLTESPLGGLARRLTGFQRQPPVDVTAPGWGRTRGQWAQAAWHGLVPLARFHVRDVLPAIRARRRHRREDIISHLLDGGAGSTEVLVECLTYATAGMITTREFIVMSLWHLLADPALAQQYLAAEAEERRAILSEIIRLDPVVGHLYRRIGEDLVLEDRGQCAALAPGQLADVHVRAANTDADVVGADPEVLRPGRSMARGIPATGLSFGAGAHRCPGEALALAETDALVVRLLALRPELITPPRVEVDDVVAGYRLDGMRLRVGKTRAPAREGRTMGAHTRVDRPDSSQERPTSQESAMSPESAMPSRTTPQHASTAPSGGMRIAVVGATGNVGTALLRRLRRAPEVTSILGVSRRGPDRDGEPFDGVEFVRCDVAEPASTPVLTQAFTGVDAVVHLAWIIRPNRDADLLHRTNVEGTRRVAEAAAAAGVPHLVVASSVGAYGSDRDPHPDDRPRDESFPTEGTASSHYAAQKAEVERILDQVEREHPQMMVSRLRPGLIFQPEAGPEIRHYFLGSLVPRGALRLLAAGALPILPWPAGVRTQALHADDVADAYWSVVRERAAGAFNVAADPVVGPDLMGTAIRARRWVPVPVALLRAAVALTYRLRLQPTDPGWIDMAVRTPVMDTSRLRRATGWRPAHDAVSTMRGLVANLGGEGGLGNADHRSRHPWE